MCWYKKGLKFKCYNCSSCCTGFPGYVWVDEKEIEQMAAFLKISKEDFIKKYTRKAMGLVSLKEDPKNYDCVFLKDKKCTIYEKRPKQCRIFPFWKKALQSKKNWEELKEMCPGIDDKAGRLYNFEEIEKISSGDEILF